MSISVTKRFSQFSQSALAHFLAQQEQGAIILAADDKAADAFYADISFFHRESILLPAWDVLPFDLLSPSERVTAQRLSSLYTLLNSHPKFVVTSPQALLQRVVSRSALAAMTKVLKLGTVIERDSLVRFLVDIGYQRVALVESLGQFSVRGSVVDFFTGSLEYAVRVEFEDESIESIRLFDSGSQRSVESITQVEVLPVRELVRFMPDENQPSDFWIEAFKKMRVRASELSVPNSFVDSIETSMRNGIFPQGIEHLWPLLDDTLESLFEYLPKAPVLLLDGSSILTHLESYSDVLDEQMQKAEANARLFPHSSQSYLTGEDFLVQLSERENWEYEPVELYRSHEALTEVISGKELGYISNERLSSELAISKSKENPFSPLVKDLNRSISESRSVAFAVEHKNRAERLQRLCLDYDIELEQSKEAFSEWSVDSHVSVSILEGRLSSGFRCPSVHLYSEYDIFPDTNRRAAAVSAKSVKRFLGQAAQLSEGDYVVHVEYGIALYKGLTQQTINGAIEDFLQLEYAENSKLFVPIYSMGKVQKYSGAEGSTPALTKLGAKTWEKAKKKVKQNVAELAGRLLQVMAEREDKVGISFGEHDVDDVAFADLFPFNETPDQASAIEDVSSDMASTKPMDRLVCGDVGYGKTEVALRAAFKAVNRGYQVAVLVPTTVLAQQHYQTFKERFEEYPFEIRCLNRFNTAASNKETLALLDDGLIDIVIGTHRLLQADVSFTKLGLLIIDEEHRFGVAAKEKLKRFRTEIDVLTLTATPIPRTLNMSLVGIRDLSLIETPPVNRQIVRTFVARYDDRMTREAILRELGRNGQVFYIHNRVQSIVERAKEVSALVPEAKVGFAHGQMKEKELEKVMLSFIDGKLDVLVSTTIIESGLDIPNANTIIIREAHAFGLAELYQLRGRVGRSSRRAFAYLFVGDPKKLGDGAKKRLEVLQALDDLGIGFRLALQDLEIRGAGNLLGKDQSGQINSVGYELYARILKDAVKDLKRRREHSILGPGHLEVDPEVNIGFPSHIPPFYIPDVAERLLLYQRMISLEKRSEVVSLEEEMEDRFGYIPAEVHILLQLMEFRVLLKNIGAITANLRDSTLRVVFHPDLEVDTSKLLKAVTESGGVLRVSGSNGLLIALDEKSKETPHDVMKFFLNQARMCGLTGVDTFIEN